jgi:hypothetical protein
MAISLVVTKSSKLAHGTMTMSSPTTTANASPLIYRLSSDKEFSYQLEVILSMADGGGANTGEVLRAASQIAAGDFETFYSSFYVLAAKIHEVAASIDVQKFPVSARDAFFRAATYFRAADFFLHGNISDPRIYSLWNSMLSDFDQGLGLLSIPGERKNVTGPGFDIPIIFYKASNDNNPRATVLVGSGYDGSQEELLHVVGKAILERGWNFVTYEGPGQPTVRRQQKLGLIPNWWDVVTPVVDYLNTRPDVDMTKLALEGISFGAILAPRAAAYEHRFAAVLVIDGSYSLFEPIFSRFPQPL